MRHSARHVRPMRSNLPLTHHPAITHGHFADRGLAASSNFCVVCQIVTDKWGACNLGAARCSSSGSFGAKAGREQSMLKHGKQNTGRSCLVNDVQAAQAGPAASGRPRASSCASCRAHSKHRSARPHAAGTAGEACTWRKKARAAAIGGASNGGPQKALWQGRAQPRSWVQPPPRRGGQTGTTCSLHNLGHHAGTHGAAALADGKPQARLHGNCTGGVQQGGAPMGSGAQACREREGPAANCCRHRRVFMSGHAPPPSHARQPPHLATAAQRCR